jgi:hypothetical protein
VPRKSGDGTMNTEQYTQAEKAEQRKQEKIRRRFEQKALKRRGRILGKKPGPFKDASGKTYVRTYEGTVRLVTLPGRA